MIIIEIDVPIRLMTGFGRRFARNNSSTNDEIVQSFSFFFIIRIAFVDRDSNAATNITPETFNTATAVKFTGSRYR